MSAICNAPARGTEGRTTVAKCSPSGKPVTTGDSGHLHYRERRNGSVSMESAHQHTCGRGAIVALIVIAGLSPVACRRPVPPRPSNIVVRLMTGTPGGGFYPVGAELASAFRKGAAPFSIDHRESGGSINNVAALQRGDADVALAYADVAYLSSIGRLEGQKRPFDHLRGMAVLQLAPIHLVVGARSGISAVSR